jgi:hypothetical protein
MTIDNDKNTIALGLFLATFLTGLRNRDWGQLRSILTDDIIWTLPGTSSISGEAQGIDAVIGHAQKIGSNGVRLTLKQILIGQHGVALSLNNTAKEEISR